MKIIVSTIILFFTTVTAHAETALIPKQINWEGKVYKLAPWDDDYKGIMYGDLTGDGIEEAIASFRGIIPEEKNPIPHPFHLIYEFVDGKPRLIKTIATEDERLGEVKIITLPGKHGQTYKALVIFSGGGSHYTSLLIHKYTNGNYESIFENGSACAVVLKDGEDPVSIWVGRENWEQEGWCYASGKPLWQVYPWDGNAFTYNSKLSTTREISEREGFCRYAKEFLKRTEEIEN